MKKKALLLHHGRTGEGGREGGREERRRDKSNRDWSESRRSFFLARSMPKRHLIPHRPHFTPHVCIQAMIVYLVLSQIVRTVVDQSTS